MGTDYREAAVRHFADAAHLEAHGRYPNAGHLYGMAAECALKALLGAVGIRSWVKPHYVHIDRLWPSFGFSCNGRTPGRYALSLEDSQPFSDWDVSHRYATEADLPLASLPTWKEAAVCSRRLLYTCILDGLYDSVC